MEKIEVLVPLAIPLNIRTLFFTEIKTNSLKFFDASWHQTKGKFPKFYGRIREYVKSYELPLEPIIPFENKPSIDSHKGGRPSKFTPVLKNLKYDTTIIARSNGLWTIVLKKHIRGKVTVELIKSEKNRMISAARKTAMDVLSHLKSHLNTKTKDPELQQAIRGISFGEVFVCYYYSGVLGSDRLDLFNSLCRTDHSVLFPDTLYSVSQDMLTLFVSNIARPYNFVHRVREGVGLAIGLKTFLEKYKLQKYYSSANDVDFAYLVHFLNPFVFRRLDGNIVFLSIPIEKWYRRVAQTLNLETLFISLLKRFSTLQNPSDICLIQILMALKKLPIGRVNLSNPNFSPATVSLSPKEKVIFLIIRELQIERSVVLRSNILKFASSKIVPNLGSKDVYPEIMEAISQVQMPKKAKNPISFVTNWYTLEAILESLVRKRYIKKTTVKRSMGRGREKPGYIIWNKDWDFAKELDRFINTYFLEL